MRKRRERTRHVEKKEEPPKRLSSTMAKLLEMPESSIADQPTVEISGNTEAVVDGCKGVVEYNDTVVRLNTGRMIIRFTGRNLQLKCMTAQSAIITGYIQSVEYSS